MALIPQYVDLTVLKSMIAYKNHATVDENFYGYSRSDDDEDDENFSYCY